MVFTIEGLFEVAIESWPEWALNPTITEFRSDALTDWAIGRWAQLALRANLVQLLQFHRLLHLVIPSLSLACYQTINIPFCEKLRNVTRLSLYYSWSSYSEAMHDSLKRGIALLDKVC